MQSQKYFSIIPKQERIQDLAQGGGTNRKIFCPPPWAPELLRRGTILRGGDRTGEKLFAPPPLSSSGGGQNSHSTKILHHLLNEFTRKYQEKNLCPPPESLRGGHFGCPPPELLRRGTILRGGTVPPLKLLRGGTVPYSPPLYPLLYIVCTYIVYWYIEVKTRICKWKKILKSSHSQTLV